MPQSEMSLAQDHSATDKNKKIVNFESWNIFVTTSGVGKSWQIWKQQIVAFNNIWNGRSFFLKFNNDETLTTNLIMKNFLCRHCQSLITMKFYQQMMNLCTFNIKKCNSCCIINYCNKFELEMHRLSMTTTFCTFHIKS